MFRKSIGSSLSLAVLSLAASLAVPAFAQTQDDERQEATWRQETIIVTESRSGFGVSEASTATRTSTPIEKIPQSIQTLTSALIDDQDLQTLPDALKSVSGVVPTSTMQTLLQSSLIRGFSVNYYFDGMPTYQNPGGIGDPATLINVERIEVAKGPTSTLFGGGTGAPLSGLVNVVSKDPSDEFEGSVAVRAGSFNTLGGQAEVSVPLGDTVSLRLAGMTEQADSFIDFIDSDRSAIFPTIAWDISPDTRLVVRGRYNKLEQREYSGLPYELIEPTQLIDRFVYAGTEDGPRTTVENTQISAVLTHQFSDRVKGDIAISRYEGEYDEWASFPYGQISGTTYNFGNGWLTSTSEQNFATASLTAEIGEGLVRHTLLVGADIDNTDYFGAMYFNPVWAALDYANPPMTAPFGPLPALFYDEIDRMETRAVFVQDQVAIGDKLDITLGLRWTDLTVESSISGAATVNEDDRVTPRIGATYEVVDGVSLFAGYSEGFKGVVAGATYGITPEPETSQSYEGGLKFATPVEGLSGTISIFEITRQNVLTPDAANPFLYLQTGEQRAKGFEMDILYEPSPALSILFNYGNTDAKVTEDNALPLGDTLRAVPEHSGRLAARYRFQEGALDPLEIGAGVTFNSERELTLPNTTAVDGNILLDAQAAWDFGGFEASLSVINLLDDDSFEPYQYFGGQYVVPVQPRSAYITLTKSF